MEDQTYAVRYVVDDRDPPMKAVMRKREANEQAALMLWETLNGRPDKYTVVGIRKETIQIDFTVTEHRIYFDLSAVQMRRVEMLETVPYSSMKWLPLTQTAFEEISRRVMIKLRGLFRRK